MTRTFSFVGTALVGAVLSVALCAPAANAASREVLELEAKQALASLTADNQAARLLEKEAKAVLVFPNILKAGFIIGGQGGEGVLFRGGTAVGYYNSLAASYGLQAGAQKFGYALFFMKEDAVAYLDKSSGWEIGVGPSVVIVDAGVGKNLSSTTLQHDIYAFIFDQKGLMAGIGIQGSKITKVNK